MIVKASCYRLNATLYFEPSSDRFLDAAAGTSDAIAGNISQQTGLNVRPLLLEMTLSWQIQGV